MNSSIEQFVNIVKKSKLFDESWYNDQYPDAYFSNMEAAEHYFRVGWKLGRDPSPNFSLQEFVSHQSSSFPQDVCPVVAFESSGSLPSEIDSKRRGPTSSKKKGSEITVVEQSALFNAQWYREQYPEAGESDRDAAWHYLAHGAKRLLNPSPEFSTRFYLQKYPDIGKAGINPLVHYEKFGRVEGRPILPAYLDRPETDPSVIASARPPRQADGMDVAAAKRYLIRQLKAVIPGEPVRMSQNFDTLQAERFMAALELCAGDDVAQERVSVVMPTYNRGAKIATAINSVLAQSWNNFELLIVDDGSTDHTPEVLATYHDPRIKVLHSQRGGVSGARNAGLRAAKGEVIFYLDSDNEWTPDFLWTMMQSMRHSGASCGYAATRLQSPQGYLIGYRGEPFDWESCLALNYVDMNVFCHRRDVSDRLGGFDTGLRRMVDWDIILRFTRDERVFYAPVIGCIYIEDSADLNRITTSEPIVSWKLVHDKNALNCTLQEVVGQLRFNIAIKIFAPYQDRDAWGDYHYAESLAEALQALGHRVRIDFRGQWYAQPVSADDVAIVLRGLEAYVPRPTQISLFWGISHPDTVPLQEYDAYQGVFIASRSYAEFLEMLLRRPVHTMWQSTDNKRFFPPPEPSAAPSSSPQGIFIGNSRREYRQIVRWAVEAGLPLEVIGQDWEAYLPKGMIRAANAPNKELAALYGSASFVLNDHWASMRDFGYVSNRVFDVLAAGGQLISDKLASIEALFGDAVISVSSAEELSLAVSGGAMNRDEAVRRRLSENVHQQHSFAQRAVTFDRWLRNYIVPDSALADAVVEEEWGHRLRVGVLANWSEPELLDMAIERIVAPLTCDAAATQLRLLRVETGEDLLGTEMDVLVIAGESCRWNADLHAAAVSRMGHGLPVFLDTGSQPVPEGMAPLLPELAGLWCDSEASARASAWKDATIMTPRLDPRLWRLYRLPRLIEAEHGVTRLLVLCSADETERGRTVPQALVDLQFDAQAVSLRIIGMEWDGLSVQLLRSCETWPENCVGYARRARWLLDNVTADIGIIFGETAHSDSQMLRMMALGVVPVIIGPAPGSFARSSQLTNLVEICEEDAALPDTLRRLMEDSAQLLRRRTECVERLWQDYNNLSSPDPRMSVIASAYNSIESKVPA